MGNRASSCLISGEPHLPKGELLVLSTYPSSPFDECY